MGGLPPSGSSMSTKYRSGRGLALATKKISLSGLAAAALIFGKSSLPHGPHSTCEEECDDVIKIAHVSIQQTAAYFRLESAVQ